jgi:hypothetical protein
MVFGDVLAHLRVKCRPRAAQEGWKPRPGLDSIIQEPSDFRFDASIGMTSLSVSWLVVPVGLLLPCPSAASES